MVEEAQQEIKLQTHYVDVDPRRLRLLELNAHFMSHETYARLVANIRKDGVLTSTPLAWQVHDDSTQEPVLDDGQPVYEVLSGNHRTKASIDAELPTITIEVVEGYIDPKRRVAMQLSHNAIFGEDDPAILKTLYESIDDVDLRLYSGLDDKTLKLLDDVTLVSLSEANLQFQTVSITFLPNELEAAKAVWEDAKKAAAGSKGHWLARWQDYDAYLDGIEATSEAHGVKNIATALMLMMRVFREHITDLQAGYLDADGEALKPKQRVPIESVLGELFIPAGTAARLNKAIQRELSAGNLDTKRRWEMLDSLLDKWEGVEDGAD